MAGLYNEAGLALALCNPGYVVEVMVEAEAEAHSVTISSRTLTVSGSGLRSSPNATR